MSTLLRDIAVMLDEPGKPMVRGASFSCDAARGLSTAQEAARKAGGAAMWYSVGILSGDRELAETFGGFCRDYALRPLFHPIDLDLSGTDPLDMAQVRLLADRAREIGAPWLNADLAMWRRGGEALLESLVPMPLVPESIPWAADRVKRAQDVLQKPIAIENAPYPWPMGDGDILQMMSAIAEEADCLMTVDVGHLYSLRVRQDAPLVRSSDADVAWDRVVESHMSGSFTRHRPEGGVIVDDKHDRPVAPEVLALARQLLPRARNLRSVMAEGEGLDSDRLAKSVREFSSGMGVWWGLS